MSLLAAEVNRHDVDFSGDWEVDYQLSDHTNEKIRQVYVETRSKVEAQLRRQNNRTFAVDPSIFNLGSIVGLASKGLSEDRIYVDWARDMLYVIARKIWSNRFVNCFCWRFRC